MIFNFLFTVYIWHLSTAIAQSVTVLGWPSQFDGPATALKPLDGAFLGFFSSKRYISLRYLETFHSCFYGRALMKLSALSAFDIDWVVSKQTSQLKKKRTVWENRKKNQERFWFQISSHKWSVAGIILFIERDRKYSETVKWENNNQYIIRLTYVHKISFT